MILDVLHIPHPTLKQMSHTISPTDMAVRALAYDMVKTMRNHSHCVGIAAPQVGRAWRLIVVDASRIDKPGSRHGELMLANPTIIKSVGAKLLREGCLSVPDYTGNVIRAEEVDVHAWDLDGRELTIQAHGFEAVVFQHEVDHINGKLFLDRVGSLETDVFRRKRYY